jgi:hypothetical protein
MNPRKTDVENDCMNIASYLAKGDKTVTQIQKRLRLSNNRWHNARRKMQEDGRLGTIPGEPVLYTLIKRAGESAVQGKALAPRRKSAFWKHVVFMKGG